LTLSADLLKVYKHSAEPHQSLTKLFII